MHHPTDRIIHTTAFVTPVVEHWMEREIAQWVHPMKDRSDDPSHHERTLLPRSYVLLPSLCLGSGLELKIWLWLELYLGLGCGFSYRVEGNGRKYFQYVADWLWIYPPSIIDINSKTRILLQKKTNKNNVANKHQHVNCSTWELQNSPCRQIQVWMSVSKW